MDKKMNTTITFEFEDGTTAEMTLFFYALYQLRSKNKPLYERYNRIMTSQSKGHYDELDMMAVLYIAYLCAQPEHPMSEEEFLYKCGGNRKKVSNAFKQLTQPKKQ